MSKGRLKTKTKKFQNSSTFSTKKESINTKTKSQADFIVYF